MMTGRMQATTASRNDSAAGQDDLPVLLVVDDDPDILRVVRFYLTKQRYHVLTAESGQEALDVLAHEPEIDLILSDVMMPEINGLDLLKAVRGDPDHGDIPVILISAEGETSKKVAGLNLGADDFITKPFNFDELMARVRNHIRLRRLQKEVVVASKQVLQANTMLQQQNDRFLEDLEAARGMQMALMPDSFPRHETFELGSRYLPAERLGGDFFDVVQLDGGRKLGVMIADVCGHGITAAFITAMTKITFQSACHESLDPGEVLAQMNRELNANLRNGFVTVFYGILDIADRSFTYASGGHPPLLVHRRREGRIIELMPQATFLGSFEPMEFPSGSVALQGGDRVIYYTDGLYESQRAPDQEFGLARVTELLLGQGDAAIQPTLDRLVEALVEFMGGTAVEDDITIVGLDIR